MLISPEQQTQPVHGTNDFNAFEILEDLEYFLPRNMQLSLHRPTEFLQNMCCFEAFFLQEMLRSVVSQSCFPSCSPGSCLWPLTSVDLPAVPVGVITFRSHQVNDQTNKIHTLGITLWQPAVEGIVWK